MPDSISCWLAQHGVHESGVMPACDGRAVRAHLIPQQLLKRSPAIRAYEVDLFDPRLWRWCCGGLTGCSGHHGMFDMARTLRVPREAFPQETWDLAVRLGVDWWVDREFRMQ